MKKIVQDFYSYRDKRKKVLQSIRQIEELNIDSIMGKVDKKNIYLNTDWMVTGKGKMFFN